MRKVLLHIPHSATDIPVEYREDFILDDTQLNKYNHDMTDLYTVELFEWNFFHVVKFPYSRLLCDVEKYLDSSKEEMSKLGMGAIYTKVYDGTQLRHNKNVNKAQIIEDLYKTHHKKLDDYAMKVFDNDEKLLVIDCHSFSDKMTNAMFGKQEHADICIGYDEEFEDKEVISVIEGVFKSNGYTIEHNSPYKGSLVPNVVFNNEKLRPKTKSVMIELNKRIYLDDNNEKKICDFDELKVAIGEIFLKIELMNQHEFEFNKDKFVMYYSKIYKNIEEYVKQSEDKSLMQPFKKMTKGYEELVNNLEFKITEFHSFMHEIKTHELLVNKMAMKVRNRKDEYSGTDFLVNDCINIECVVSTFGSLEDPYSIKLSEPKFGVYDPKPHKLSILPRITSSLKEKIDKFETYKVNMNDDDPYIIFVNLSLLRTNHSFGNNFEDLLIILLDAGDRVIYLNKETMQYSHSDFVRNNNLVSRNKSNIPLGLFLKEKYSFISAIIFTDSQFGDFYSKDNTAIFMNPEAINPVEPLLFKSINIFGVIEEDEFGYTYGKINVK